MISGQCANKGLKYDCNISGHVDDYYVGDALKLRQILINILGNAVKFTPEGGSINFTIEAGPRYDGKATLIFTIADTGVGMTPDYLPHIFDAFSQEGETSAPVVLVPTSFNTVYEEEFKARGANIIIYANQLTRTGFPAMQDAARTILENHRAKECDDKCMPIKEIINLIPAE